MNVRADEIDVKVRIWEKKEDKRGGDFVKKFFLGGGG